jgi:glucuronate isomerase
LPTFRADKALAVDDAAGYNAYLNWLGEVAGGTARLQDLERRCAANDFASVGRRLRPRPGVVCSPYTARNEGILPKNCGGNDLTGRKPLFKPLVLLAENGLKSMHPAVPPARCATTTRACSASWVPTRAGTASETSAGQARPYFRPSDGQNKLAKTIIH